MRAESTTETSWQAKWLGTIDYLRAWELQAATVAERRAGRGVDTLYLLEHPPTYTVGRRGGREHLLVDDDTLARLEAVVYEVDRGGDITYHGPGQLVAYLLLDMRRRGIGVRPLVRQMEQAVINLLADYGVAAEGRTDAPGVYVGAAKIAALGLRVRNGCCYHGLALNVDVALEPFSAINPCGYPGLEVTRTRDLGITDNRRQLGERLIRHIRTLLQ